MTDKTEKPIEQPQTDNQEDIIDDTPLSPEEEAKQRAMFGGKTLKEMSAEIDKSRNTPPPLSRYDQQLAEAAVEQREFEGELRAAAQDPAKKAIYISNLSGYKILELYKKPKFLEELGVDKVVMITDAVDVADAKQREGAVLDSDEVISPLVNHQTRIGNVEFVSVALDNIAITRLFNRSVIKPIGAETSSGIFQRLLEEYENAPTVQVQKADSEYAQMQADAERKTRTVLTAYLNTPKPDGTGTPLDAIKKDYESAAAAAAAAVVGQQGAGRTLFIAEDTASLFGIREKLQAALGEKKVATINRYDNPSIDEIREKSKSQSITPTNKPSYEPF